MLKESHAVLPATDLQRARTFYHDKLGLDPDEIEEGVLSYRSENGAFDVYETSNAGTAQNTQIGWMTDDRETEVQGLRKRGVVFEEYDTPDFRTVNGIATSDAIKTAWFRDTEGNFLCISQRL